MAFVYKWYVTDKRKDRRHSAWVEAPDRDGAIQKACAKLGLSFKEYAGELMAYQIGKVAV